jgi:Asp-tRNA(Asn)/Glu-tRNA(Gln) amidotransferase A subunit family amidase
MSLDRRRFLAAFSAAGVASTLLPGVLWARVQEEGAKKVTMAMLNDALAVSGLTFSDEDKKQILENLNPGRYDELRKVVIDDTIAPPLYYSPLVPGTRLDRTSRPVRMGRTPGVKRPAALEDAAFWPLTHLAELIRTRQVTSTELTKMYLARLRRYNPTLNFVVSFTDDLAMKQAAQADQEIAAGKYRGPLHGIPWGCKDIISVPGYKTTWGSGAFEDQQLETEATVVKLLREAGAVLVAKLATGELAAGDRWFGGRTNSPWDPKDGSSGSSAGPGSATAAGCVAFAIGSETSGSILSPASVNGVSGLRPTFGRVSRYGAMTLSWSMDRLGPMCRTAEDCAVVLHTIARADEHDLSVIDLPFNWDAQADVRKLRVGYLAAGFAETSRDAEWRQNDERVFAELKAMGVTLEPFELPKMPSNVLNSILGTESGAAFDQSLRSGRLERMTNRSRSNGFRSSRLTPAVEYLQAQRARFIVMQKLAEVVGKFDVYLAPATGGGGARGRGATDAALPATPPTPPPPQPPSATRDHFSAANICGYPAISIPNGFTKEGKPTAITFLGRLYNEAGILALAKAYQDRAGWHKRTPILTIGATTTAGRF